MKATVVIPSYGRRKQLRQCLDSLFKQDCPQEDFEIIVVDDGSKDTTPALLEELSKSHPNLKYFFQTHKGPAAARNLGMRRAGSDIICFVDNDCILESDWVRKMVEAHELNPGIAAVGGLTRVNHNNLKAAVSQCLSDGAIEAPVGISRQVIFLPTCNVSVKRKLLKGREFNELFSLPAGEDLEFFWRIFKQGGRFLYRKDIGVLHDCHPGFGSFLWQSYAYGRGNYLVKYLHRDHPLLKEIKTGNNASFVLGSLLNFLKVPRFSYILGRRLISSLGKAGFYQRIRIYAYFTLHKIIYLAGNAAQHVDTASRHKHPAGFPLKPEFIILDITHNCNLKCNICEIRKDGRGREFTTPEVKRLIRQACEWGVKEFVLSGGEPFTRGDIFEILDFAKAHRYHLGVLTNGIMLDDNFINRIAPYLISGSLSLSISLDAMTSSIHDQIRGASGCFKMTLAGLRSLSKLKEQHRNINFNTISIILNDNLEELPALAEFLKSLQVNSIQFQPLLANNLAMQQRDGRVRFWVPESRLGVLDKSIEQLIDFKRANPGLVLNSEDNLRLIKKYFRSTLAQGEVSCAGATKTMLIADSGQVTTCFGAYGDARKDSLRKIFASGQAAKIRERVKNCQSPCLLPCFCDYPAYG